MSSGEPGFDSAPELDSVLDAYRATVAERGRLETEIPPLIDAEKAVIQAAQDRIDSLARPLFEADAKLRQLVSDGAKLGETALSRDLPPSRRILAGFMAGQHRSLEEASRAASQLAQIDAGLEAGEKIPILVSTRNYGDKWEVHMGLIKGYKDNFDEGKAMNIAFSLENPTLVSRDVRSDGLPPYTRKNDKDELVLPRIDLHGEVFSAANMHSEFSAHDALRGTINGVLVGGEAISAFFVEYVNGLVATTASTPFEQNHVLNLWLGLNQAGIEITIPEYLRLSWLAKATHALAESFDASLSRGTTGGINVPLMLEVFYAVGGDDAIVKELFGDQVDSARQMSATESGE